MSLLSKAVFFVVRETTKIVIESGVAKGAEHVGDAIGRNFKDKIRPPKPKKEPKTEESETEDEDG